MEEWRPVQAIKKDLSTPSWARVSARWTYRRQTAKHRAMAYGICRSVWRINYFLTLSIRQCAEVHGSRSHWGPSASASVIKKSSHGDLPNNYFKKKQDHDSQLVWKYTLDPKNGWVQDIPASARDLLPTATRKSSLPSISHKTSTLLAFSSTYFEKEKYCKTSPIQLSNPNSCMEKMKLCPIAFLVRMSLTEGTSTQ